jgi:hypothetical protein
MHHTICKVSCTTLIHEFLFAAFSEAAFCGVNAKKKKPASQFLAFAIFLRVLQSPPKACPCARGHDVQATLCAVGATHVKYPHSSRYDRCWNQPLLQSLDTSRQHPCFGTLPTSYYGGWVCLGSGSLNVSVGFSKIANVYTICAKSSALPLPCSPRPVLRLLRSNPNNAQAQAYILWQYRPCQTYSECTK